MARSTLKSLLANDQVTVDWSLSTAKAKKRTPAQRILLDAKRTELEYKFLGIWRQLGGEPDFWVKAYIPGFDFAQCHEYELDFYNEATSIAVEIQGGQYMPKSGHSNIDGLGRDADKLARCNVLGIMLFHLPTNRVSAEWVNVILQLAKRRVQ